MKKSTRNLLLLGLGVGGYLYWKNQQAPAVVAPEAQPVPPAPVPPGLPGVVAGGLVGAAQSVGQAVAGIANAFSNLLPKPAPQPQSGYVSPTYTSRVVRNYNGLSGYVSPTYSTRAVRTYS